jgi:hypothetical protein
MSYMTRPQLEASTPALLRRAKERGCDCEAGVEFIEAAGNLGVGYLTHADDCGWQEPEAPRLPRWHP